MSHSQDRIFDVSMRLKDATAAVTADALATVGGATATLDMGVGRFQGDLVLDVSAIDVAGSDELYNFKLVGSNSATFASGTTLLATKQLGAFERLNGAGPIGGIDADIGVGRYIVPFDNQQNTASFRYLRLLVDGDSTAATWSVTYTAFVSQRQ